MINHLCSPTIVAAAVAVGFWTTLCATSLAGISPTKAGYVDVTAAPYNADPTGQRDATAAIQRACDDAVTQVRPVYLPAGVYRLSGEIQIDKAPHRSREANGLTIRGPSSGKGRAVLRLASGSFTDPAHPRPMVGVYYDKVDAGNRLCMVIEHVDLEIEPDNAGAAGLSWGGAEAGLIADVHVRGTGGYRGFKYGFWTTLGSGGSMVRTSVIGGEYGYYIAAFSTIPNGSRETASLTDITSEGASVAAIYANTEWACAVTAGKFVMDPGVPVMINKGAGPGHPWTLSGAPLFIDCVAQWTAPDSGNVLLRYNEPALPFYLANTYLENCSAVLESPDRIEANPSGWRHYAELAYDPQNRGVALGYPVKTGIYVGGTKLDRQKIYSQSQDGAAPPTDLQSRHRWGGTFPDLDSPGAVLLTDYADRRQGDDWAPVFRYLIHELGAPVIILPKGRYPVQSTIDMKPQTAILGTIQWFTEIWGTDGVERFGGSTDAPNDAQPAVRSSDAPDARCILANLRVLQAVDKANPRAMAVFPIHWRSGPDSVIRNVYAQSETPGAYWIHQTADILAGDGPNGIHLRVVPSPLVMDGYRFSSDSHTKYHDGIEIPDQLILQTIDGNQRLTVPSVWPYPDDSPRPHAYPMSNLTVDRSGEAFSIARLTLYNTSPLNGRGGVVLIVAFDRAGQELGRKQVSLGSKSRRTAVPVELGWNDCSKLVLTCPTQFDVDDVVLGQATLGFNSLEGEKPVVDKHYDSWNPAGIWRDMGLSPQWQPNILITGGAKFYNHAVHGGQAELNYRVPHTLVQNNTAPVRFYHFHAQHGDNDGYLHLVNANDVALYGMKTETSTSFIRCYSSRGIRLYGMGGATNPVSGHAIFHFQDCQDLTVACAFDVIYNAKRMIWGGEGRPWGNSHQNASNTFDGYHVIEDVQDGRMSTPEKADRPTLYKR